MKHNIKKRLFSMLLAINLLISLYVPCVSAAETDRAQELGGEYWELMTALGIFDEEDGYTPGEEISRGTFVRLLMKLGNWQPVYMNGKSSSFADVDASDENAGYIETAHQLGYINGYSNGSFCPEQSITGNEATKLLLDLLGYTKYADVSGGYAEGYAKLAYQLDLFENAHGANNDALTWDYAVIMARNAAHTEVMRTTSEGASMYQETIEGETLLIDRFSIYDTKSVIEANEYTALLDADSGIQSGYVVADGDLYKVGNTNAADCLGMNMHMYYHYDESTGDYTLLYITPNADKNSVLEIDARDISGLNSDRTLLKYFEGNETEKAKISESAYFIYNGKMAELKPEKLIFEVGEVRLISNDNDNEYDIISVMSYETYIVSATTETNCKINTKQGVTLELDSENELDTRIIKKNGKIVGFDEIKKNNIISYAESETGVDTVKTVIVSDRTITGSAESVDAEEYIVRVGGVEYKAIASLIDGLKVGHQGTFYIDAFGNLAYCTGKYDVVYGYLNHIGSDEIDDVFCKIFTENNRWVVLKMCEKIKFNGKRAEALDVLNTLGKTADEHRQLIRYTVNDDGELNMLETAEEIAMGTAANDQAIRDDKFRLSSSGQQIFRTTIGTFDGIVGVKSNAKIFAVPNQGSGTNEDGFGILAYSDLQQDQSYKYEAYNANEVRNSDVIVINDYVEAMNAGSTISTMMLVRSIGEMVNADDELCPSIIGYWGSDEKVTLPTNLSEKSPVTDLSTLNRGDIIQFTYNAYGEIDNVELKYSSGTEYALSPSDSPYKYASFIAGKVLAYSEDDQRMILQYNDGGSTSQYSTGGAKVYIYDTESQTVSLGAVSDIMTDDQLFVSARYLMCREIYIIRN